MDQEGLGTVGFEGVRELLIIQVVRKVEPRVLAGPARRGSVDCVLVVQLKREPYDDEIDAVLDSAGTPHRHWDP